MWKNIVRLKFWNRKPFRILSVICGFAIAVSVWSLFGHDATYTFDVRDMKINAGEYVESLEGVYIDESIGFTGNAVECVGIALPKGVYQIQFGYETTEKYASVCEISAPLAGFRGMYANCETLHTGLTTTDYNAWIMRDMQGINVSMGYSGGTLIVRDLTIQETNDLQKMTLFFVVLASIGAMGAYIYFQYERQYGVELDKKKVFACLLLVTLVASMPLMGDYIVNGGDTGYHLNRIEGLKDGLLSGQFPVRIAPRWLEDNGYASAVFYCEIMLLPAALFRMLGFTVTVAYQLYVFLINGLTAWVAYYSFSKMFKNRSIGIFCSMLHTLSIYRIFRTYLCGSLGEMLGILWLPLVVYGFYRVFSEDNKAQSYRWSFVPLCVGYAGLIQSHMLSCELTGGFTVLLCIVMWKKVIQKETFQALAKAATFAAFIGMWFIVPFLDYMLTGNFVIHNVSGRTIQEAGVFLAHLFMAIPFSGSEENFYESGMMNTAPVGVGFALMCVLALWAYLTFVYGYKELDEKMGRKVVVAGNVLAIFAVIGLAMSLRAFPWDYLQSMNGLFATLISSIQFPYRFFTIATVLLVALAGIIGVYFKQCKRECVQFAYFGGITVLTVITSLFLLSDFMGRTSFSRIHNIEGMGFGYIAGAEYLPYGADQNTFVFRNPTSSEEVIIDGYEKGSLSWDVNCYNVGSEEGHVVMPLLYYKGYQSWDADTGENLRTYQGDDFSVWVEVPEGYSGVIHTEFVSPWYWRVAELISVITVLSMVLLYRRDKKRLIMQKEA